MSTETEVKKKIVLKRPAKYCNAFYNNDHTPYNFVVHIIMEAFGYTQAKAEEKTKEIHEKNKGIIFISSKENCETKKEYTDKLLQVLEEKNFKHEVKLYEDES